jgi:hypothetical protein
VERFSTSSLGIPVLRLLRSASIPPINTAATTLMMMTVFNT